MTLADVVRADATAHGFALDPAQGQALDVLARVVTGAAEGLYLWGRPGRGKTWLVDAALRAAAPPGLLRVHFHDLYAQLAAATRGGRAFAVAAQEVLAGVRLLVLDELHLDDSDDAWMAERVVRSVVDRGGAVVVTSNHEVADLHRSPLHAHHADGLRALLRAHCTVVACDGDVDHRQEGPAADRPRFSSGAFLSPGGSLADLGLVRPAAREPLVVSGRPLPVLGADDHALWVTFEALCARPTSTADYAALAQAHPTWVLVGVPPLRACPPDVRARFLGVVDVAHDRDVRLVLVARQDREATLGPDDLLPDWPRLVSRVRLLQPGASTSATTSATPS